MGKTRQRNYTNPVYSGYFADPFVFQYRGLYYAYGTGGIQPNGRVVEVLQSSNLVDWVSLGGALEPLNLDQELSYWAPEVVYNGERFYLYYSVGVGDQDHKIRVATAPQPQGPFWDVGLELTKDLPFAIDAHPFKDDDGQWYLFYARDFLEGDRVGTALEVDRLRSMTQLEGQPRTVLRANADWQIYQRGRVIYGQVYDWHTLEGPFVVKRNGRYYCFYSGGNWQNLSYGVSYAVADHPLGPWQEPQVGSPAILRTIPNQVIGPGHNSVVQGPDGHDYLVYHAWDRAKTARRMCISPLAWVSGEPRIDETVLLQSFKK